MLTYDGGKGYQALEPGALEFCHCSAIMPMAELTLKQSKKEQNCERSN